MQSLLNNMVYLIRDGKAYLDENGNARLPDICFDQNVSWQQMYLTQPPSLSLTLEFREECFSHSIRTIEVKNQAGITVIDVLRSVSEFYRKHPQLMGRGGLVIHGGKSWRDYLRSRDDFLSNSLGERIAVNIAGTCALSRSLRSLRMVGYLTQHRAGRKMSILLD